MTSGLMVLSIFLLFLKLDNSLNGFTLCLYVSLVHDNLFTTVILTNCVATVFGS